MKLEKLTEEIKNKLCEVIDIWAEEYLPGKPAILATAVYFNIENLLLEKTNEVIENFNKQE